MRKCDLKRAAKREGKVWVVALILTALLLALQWVFH